MGGGYAQVRMMTAEEESKGVICTTGEVADGVEERWCEFPLVSSGKYRW
jgi:hypothetical protein